MVIDRDDYPGLKGDDSLVIDLRGITQVSKIDCHEHYRVKIKRLDQKSQFIDFSRYSSFIPDEIALISRNRVCEAILTDLKSCDGTGKTESPPSLPREPEPITQIPSSPEAEVYSEHINTSDTSAPSASFNFPISTSFVETEKPKQQLPPVNPNNIPTNPSVISQNNITMNPDNSGALSTIVSDVKSFVRENRNVIYTVIAIILIDKFVLDGKLTDRIKALADRLLGHVEKKVDVVTAETPKS